MAAMANASRRRTRMDVASFHTNPTRKRGSPSLTRRVSSQSKTPLGPDQVLIRLTTANQLMIATVHQHFRGTRPAIVVRCHRHAVRAGTEYRQQIAARDRREIAVLRQEVARLA